MAWYILIIAGLLEIGWAFCLKRADGFTRLWPTVGFGVMMLASVGLLGLSLKTLPIGTAYAVWTGVGAVGTVLVGIAFLGDSADPRRIFCLILILSGIIGLKLTSPD